MIVLVTCWSSTFFNCPFFVFVSSSFRNFNSLSKVHNLTIFDPQLLEIWLFMWSFTIYKDSTDLLTICPAHRSLFTFIRFTIFNFSEKLINFKLHAHKTLLGACTAPIWHILRFSLTLLNVSLRNTRVVPPSWLLSHWTTI